MLIFKVLGDQQAAEGLRKQSDVIDHAEYENRRYIVDKWVQHPHFFKFPKNRSPPTKIPLK